MDSVFWDKKGILLIYFLPQGEKNNAYRYCETLKKEGLAGERFTSDEEVNEAVCQLDQGGGGKLLRGGDFKAYFSVYEVH